MTEPSSDGERVCLSQHAQFHYVHIYGFYCEGVKDVLVKDAGELCWLDSGISEKGWCQRGKKTETSLMKQVSDRVT